MVFKNLNKKTKTISPEKVADILRNILRAGKTDWSIEYFWVIGVRAKKIIYLNKITLGFFLNRNIIHYKEIFSLAILQGMDAIILAHNASPERLTADKDNNRITKAVTDAGKILDIELLDHIIVGRDRYYSYQESAPQFFGPDKKGPPSRG